MKPRIKAYNEERSPPADNLAHIEFESEPLVQRPIEARFSDELLNANASLNVMESTAGESAGPDAQQPET